MSYEEFVSTYAGFDWDSYFDAAGIEQLDTLNVSFPSAMAPIIDFGDKKTK